MGLFRAPRSPDLSAAVDHVPDCGAVQSGDDADSIHSRPLPAAPGAGELLGVELAGKFRCGGGVAAQPGGRRIALPDGQHLDAVLRGAILSGHWDPIGLCRTPVLRSRRGYHHRRADCATRLTHLRCEPSRLFLGRALGHVCGRHPGLPHAPLPNQAAALVDALSYSASGHCTERPIGSSSATRCKNICRSTCASHPCSQSTLLFLRRWDDVVAKHWSVLPLLWCGQRSYSIYLTHYPLVVVASSALALAGLTSELSVATIVVPACLVMSLPIAWSVSPDCRAALFSTLRWMPSSGNCRVLFVLCVFYVLSRESATKSFAGVTAAGEGRAGEWSHQEKVCTPFPHASLYSTCQPSQRDGRGTSRRPDRTGYSLSC